MKSTYWVRAPGVRAWPNQSRPGSRWTSKADPRALESAEDCVLLWEVGQSSAATNHWQWISGWGRGGESREKAAGNFAKLHDRDWNSSSGTRAAAAWVVWAQVMWGPRRRHIKEFPNSPEWSIRKISLLGDKLAVRILLHSPLCVLEAGNRIQQKRGLHRLFVFTYST